MPKIVELKNINKIYGENTPNPTQVLFDLEVLILKHQRSIQLLVNQVVGNQHF